MRRRRIEHQRNLFPMTKLRQILNGIHGSFELREHQASAANHLEVCIQIIRPQCRIRAWGNHDDVVTLRRNNDHRDAGTIFNGRDRRNIHPGLLQTRTQFVSKGITADFADHANRIPESRDRDCLVAALSAQMRFELAPEHCLSRGPGCVSAFETRSILILPTTTIGF